jgi:hypothetical protein
MSLEVDFNQMKYRCDYCQGMGSVGVNAAWNDIVLNSFGAALSTSFKPCPKCKGTKEISEPTSK